MWPALWNETIMHTDDLSLLSDSVWGRLAPQRLHVTIAGRVPECFQSTLWSAVRSFERDGTPHVLLRAGDATRSPLTPREKQIVSMRMKGQSTKSIAYDLQIAPSTARVLLSRALTKLGVSSPKELGTIDSSPEELDAR
jgi:DNA-binding CsgD family transcriptional regulator